MGQDKRFTPEEAEVLYYSLSCRKNLIETGDTSLSAADIQSGHKGVIKALSSNQMKILLKIDELMKECTKCL